MGQCCSSKNKSNKKKNSQKVVATTTVPGPYYEDDYTAPVSPIRHMFSEPGPATPEESTEVVVNRKALEAVTFLSLLRQYQMYSQTHSYACQETSVL